ncbi:MAG: hypothetical protein K0U93_24060 [Gammaproteobacteria bacterium]|nr:hypothetical protein [Gammaproteobacteria bacterium]
MPRISQDLLKRYLTARKAAATASDQATQLQDEIKSRMGDAQYLKVGPYTINWAWVTKKPLNQTVLKNGYPTIFAACCQEQRSRPFKVEEKA